jgi:YegS/Rv2252/BmrU family lipid kinase
MRTLLIVNPMSGARGQRWRSQDLPGMVQSWFPEAALHLTRGEGDATEAARQAVRDELDLVVAVGGDGTVNEVVNGLVGSSVHLGILPAGTENVLAKERHVPSALEKAALYLKEAPARRADVVRVGERHFLCFAGIGFDALVVDKMQPDQKAKLGAMAYVMTGFEQMFKYQEVARTATIQVDETPPLKVDFWQIIVANIQTYGGGLRPAPRASMHDGLLDMVVWPRADLPGMIHQIVATATGAHLGLAEVKYLQGQRIWIDTDPPSLVQVDGDLLGHTPVLFEVLPQALWIRF